MVNRRRVFLGLVGAVVAGGTASAQWRAADDVTVGEKNGRWWNEQSPLARLGYLFGFEDSTQSMASQLLSSLGKSSPEDNSKFETVSNAFWPVDIKVGEMEEAVTRMFANPANIRLQIPAVMFAATMQFKGESAQAVEKFLEQMRAVISRPSA